MSLNISGDGGPARGQQQGAGLPLENNLGPGGPAADARQHLNQHNHFFHFDGKAIQTCFTTQVISLNGLY